MRWIEDAVPEEGETSDQAPAKGGKWVLGLPGLGEEPLTWDLLLPLLPKTVEVVTAAGKTVVDLVWDLDANLDGANGLEGAPPWPGIMSWPPTPRNWPFWCLPERGKGMQLKLPKR